MSFIKIEEKRMLSKKRKKRMVLIGTLCITILVSGCGKKDVDYNVDEKQENSNGDNMSAGTEGSLSERLRVPKSCDISIDGSSAGTSTITIKDDEISVPKTDSSVIDLVELSKEMGTYQEFQ